LTISFSESFLGKSITEEVNESPMETNKDPANGASAATLETEEYERVVRDDYGWRPTTLRNVHGLEAGITKWTIVKYLDLTLTFSFRGRFDIR
jgi:hypothetical protein